MKYKKLMEKNYDIYTFDYIFQSFEEKIINNYQVINFYIITIT